MNYQKQNYSFPKITPVIKNFKKVNLTLLKKLFEIQTPTLDYDRQQIFLKFILDWCNRQKIEISTEQDDFGNLYITKGSSEIYPCVVSHIDTVHEYNPHLRILDYGGLVFGLDISNGEQHGIGADPKNGVYFALEMLRTVPNLKVVLFLDEESGCLGSRNCEMSFFKDCSFVIQLDRRSFTTDIIEYTNGIQCLSEDFKKKVLPICTEFGYSFSKGTATDVGELVWQKLGICAFNFSNGSFNEHMEYETCSIPHLLNAINAGYEIIKTLGYKKRWVFIPDTKPKSLQYGGWSSSYTPSKSLWDPTVIEQFVGEHIFKKSLGQTNDEAALNYYYEADEEESIHWMYEYFIEAEIDYDVLISKIKQYLTLNYSELEEVRMLLKKINEYEPEPIPYY